MTFFPKPIFAHTAPDGATATKLHKERSKYKAINGNLCTSTVMFVVVTMATRRKAVMSFSGILQGFFSCLYIERRTALRFGENMDVEQGYVAH